MNVRVNTERSIAGRKKKSQSPNCSSSVLSHQGRNSSKQWMNYVMNLTYTTTPIIHPPPSFDNLRQKFYTIDILGLFNLKQTTIQKTYVCFHQTIKETVLAENNIFLLYIFMQLCIEQLLYRIKLLYRISIFCSCLFLSS